MAAGEIAAAAMVLHNNIINNHCGTTNESRFFRLY